MLKVLKPLVVFCLLVTWTFRSAFADIRQPIDRYAIRTDSFLIVAFADSLAKARVADSLMLPENRYYFPDTVDAFAAETERQIQNGEARLKIYSDWQAADLGGREVSIVMRYLNRRSIMADRVRPEPLKPIPEDSLLDYPPMNPMFMPLIFNSHPETLRMERQKAPWQSDGELDLKLLEEDNKHLGANYMYAQTRQLIRYMESHRIDLVRYTASDLPKPERIDVYLPKEMPIRYMPSPANRPEEFPNIPKTSFEYTYWVLKGRVGAQMTQTFISDNWSAGGASNMSGLYTFYWTAKYNDKNKIQFDNVVDMKIGINTTSTDSLRHFNVGTDQFQASSKLGIKAVKNWFYSVSAELITQSLPNYKPNTMTLKSSLLSPAKFFVSLGMDYKVTSADKSKSLSVLLTPFTYRLNYLMDTKHFKAKDYGIDEGRHVGHEFGFKLSSTFDWKISEDFNWNSYLYYYSDFSYVDSEWKNTLNFKVNQYLSTQLFMHFKFDDRVRNKEYSFPIQFKEYLSFGITYYW